MKCIYKCFLIFIVMMIFFVIILMLGLSVFNNSDYSKNERFNRITKLNISLSSNIRTYETFPGDSQANFFIKIKYDSMKSRKKMEWVGFNRFKKFDSIKEIKKGLYNPYLFEKYPMYIEDIEDNDKVFYFFENSLFEYNLIIFNLTRDYITLYHVQLRD